MADVEITASGDVTSLINSMERAGKSGSKMAGDIERAGGAGAKSSESSSSRIVGSLKKIVAAGAIVAAGKQVFDFTKGLVDAAAESEKVSAQTTSVIKATGGAANLTAQGISDLAGAISKKNAVDDEGAQSGLNMLLTFKNIRNEAGKGNDVFNQTGQVLADMSRAMGTDMSSSAIQLGKALNDPIKGVGALSRVGVTFDDQQKKQIKSMVAAGDVMGAQKVILKELNGEFGGSGAAYAATYAGKMDALKVSAGNLQEKLGGALLPVLGHMADGATRAFDWLNEDGRFTEFANVAKSAFDGIMTVIQPLVDAFQGQLGSSVSDLGGQFMALAPQLSPILLVLKALAPFLPQIAGLIGQLAGTIVAGLLPVLPVIAGLFGQVGKILSTVFAAALPVVATLLQTLAGVFKAVLPSVAGLLPVVGQLIGVLADVITPVLGVVSALSPLLGALGQLLAAVLPPVISLLGVVITVVLAVAKPLLGVLVPAITFVATVLATLITWIVQGITWFVKLATGTKQSGDVLNAIFKGIQSVVSGVFGFIRDYIAASVKNWQTVIGGVVSFITGLFTNTVRGWQIIFNAVWTAIRTATSTVFGAIRGVVSGIVNAVGDFISGAVNGYVTLMRTGWNMIVSATTSIFGRIVGVVSGVVGRVIDVVSGIAGKVKGAISNAGSLLLGIGRNIIDGLVRGIRGGIDGVMSAVRGLIDKIPAAARKLLGIASPSKVFIQIARFIGEGLIEGLRGSRDDVVKAMTDLVQKIQDAPSKAFRGGSKAKNALVEALKNDQKALAVIASDRDKVVAKLENANARLDAARKVRDDYQDAVSGGVAALGLATAAKGGKDADGNDLAVTAADVIASKQSALNRTQKFLDDVKALRAAGLNEDDYKAIVDAFQSSGDTSLADTLTAGGPAIIKQVNDINAQLQSAAGRLGQETSDRLYQAGVQAIKSEIDGLESQRASLTGAIGAIESVMADQLKAAGINAGALAVQAGKDVAAGLANGAKSNRKMLEDTFEDLGGAMVKAIKKKLKIKSPSRVADEEVGQMFGLGAVQGVVKTYGKMEDAVGGLVKVPKLQAVSVSPAAAAQAATGYTGVGAAPAGGGSPVNVTIAVPPKADRDDVQYAEDMMGAVRFGVSAAVGGGVTG